MGHFQKQCHRQRFNILRRSFISSFLWYQNDQHIKSSEHWDAQSQVDGMSINILEVQQLMKKRGKMYFKRQMRGMTWRKVFFRHHMVEEHMQRWGQYARDTGGGTYAELETACTTHTQTQGRQIPNVEEGRWAQILHSSWSYIGIWLFLGAE